jgi:NADH-quinone oxidoreductase subunit L
MLPYLLIPLLPFIGFLIVGIFWPYFRGKGHWIAVPLIFASFFLSLKAFFDTINGPPLHFVLYDWIHSGHFDVSISIMIDHLTAIMLVMVTAVSALTHLYTVGYMKDDSGYDRFFAYISLFTFSMIMLLMSDNLLELFIFWEAVGFCSYVLIAHWYERKPSWLAANKAFIMNRVGDFGFLLGILLTYVTFGTLNYSEIFQELPQHIHDTINVLSGFHQFHESSVITVIALLLFVGAIGKSAQIPLHPWLPDAMEGPTPISALIHAATMVTAGIFMIARLSPIYNASPTALYVVAWTGALTAFVAATIALTQRDIKKIVAYSTMSQLGYMVMACGIGAYGAGIFHLLTHGFFKGLLFLAAGSVIHALAGEQDVFRMGGLGKIMKITFPTMLVGSLALSGIPPFAGFYSKDLILSMAFQDGPTGHIFWVIGVVTALLTAFYSFRLIFMVFSGKERFSQNEGHHDHAPHESPLVITIPLLALAVCAIVAGWMGERYDIVGYLAQDMTVPHAVGRMELSESSLKGISVAVGVLGILIAFVMYGKPSTLPQTLARTFQPLFRLSQNKWYFDELYDLVFVRPTIVLSHLLWVEVDKGVIDMAVNGVASFCRTSGAAMRRIQTGQLQNYALVMALGLFGMVSLYLLIK